MLNICYMGHGGNRYLAENIFRNVLKSLQFVKLTIISEWEPNPELVPYGVEYVKYDVNHWMDVYKKADIILCPQNPLQPAKSHIKVITAFAMKKPVICSHHPAYEEIVKDGYNGYYYNQPSDLIDIIDKLQNKEHREFLGQNGYKSIVNKFHPKTIANKLSNYICSDLRLPLYPSWVPTQQKSGLRRIRKQPETLKVDVVYMPLQIAWQSYGDFICDAFVNYLGIDNVRHHNTLGDMIKYNNIHGWGRDLFVFIEFNENWYNIPKEMLNRSIMYGWDTHSHYMFSHLYNLCRRFKSVYISGKEDVERIYASGVSSVKWCPEAHCDRIHNVKNCIKYDRLIFVGQIDTVIRDPGGLTRLDYLTFLQNKYKDRFLVIRNVYGNDYSKLIRESKLNLDLPIAHNIGTRSFESQAIGTQIIRADNGASGFDDFFRDGVNMTLFEPGNLKDLCNKIDRILSMDENEMTEKSKTLIEMAKYQSYDHRVGFILEDLGL